MFLRRDTLSVSWLLCFYSMLAHKHIYHMIQLNTRWRQEEVKFAFIFKKKFKMISSFTLFIAYIFFQVN